jgi:hypothetical protein
MTRGQTVRSRKNHKNKPIKPDAVLQQQQHALLAVRIENNSLTSCVGGLQVFYQINYEL